MTREKPRHKFSHSLTLREWYIARHVEHATLARRFATRSREVARMYGEFARKDLADIRRLS